MPRTQELKNILWLLLISALAAQLIVEITGISKSPLSTIKTSFEDGETFLSFAFIGTYLIYLWARPCPIELTATTVLGGLFNLLFYFFRVPADQTPMRIAETFGYGLGTAVMVILAVTAWRERGEERAWRLETMMNGSVIPIYVILVEFFLRITYLRLHVYDRLLYAFDTAYGLNFSFAVGRMFMASDALKLFCLVIYLALPLAFSILIGMQQRNPERAPVNVFIAFLSLGAVGFVLYQIFPAIGPRYFHGDIYPLGAPPPALNHDTFLNLEPLRRNAMPSLHTAWVLILWLNSRWYARWMQIFSGIFTFFTLLCTLGIGEHYIVDLFVAVPLTVVVQAACTSFLPLWKGERWAALAGGTGLVAVWYVVIWFCTGWLQRFPALTWGFTIVTTAAAVRLEWKLARKAKERLMVPSAS
ncbi:MAG: phosphatase PAP2 family protein [Blastocatellia bacterium]|nr:phosphatase PAP2 family protein [Blastocatellia bacterium]